jgi:KDO2-lipid IV(A) lauroyltransferase
VPDGKRWRYRIEAAAIWCGFVLLRALPLDVASALGGLIARGIGPLLPISRRAAQRLRRAMPEIGAAEAQRIIRGMWDNLGRVAGEYAHLDEFHLYAPGSRVEVVGSEHIDALRDDGVGGIFFSGHYGNWELLSLAAGQRGVPLTLVYREANNPAAELLLQKVRAAVPGEHLAKGSTGARAALAALIRGAHLGMLVDQKLNDGIAVPFFGRDAMTAPALARFALRFRCPVVPARVERLGGAHFRLTIFPPLRFADSGHKEADTLAAMTAVNALLEGWIRERPDHWFWLHRRWPE